MAEKLVVETAKDFAVEVGKTVIIIYGPKILRKIKLIPGKVHARLYFTIVSNFYQAEDYEKVFEMLSKFLDDYRVKDIGKNYLKIGKNDYEYLLSITPRQDFIPLIELNEYFPPDIGTITSEELSALIYASSARLFLWPSGTGYEISVKELETVITDIYDFHKKLDMYMHDLMKSNVFGATRILLYLSLEISNMEVIKRIIDKIKRDSSYEKFRVNLNENKLEALIDDSNIIDKLIRALGG